MRNNIITILLFFVLFQSSLFAQICPGTQGSVKWQCWRNMYDVSLSELSAHEFFPHSPDVVQTIYSIDAPINYDNNIGGRIAGYIRINTTDSVQFNMTCNERGQFMLSTDDNPANLRLVASVPANTNLTEHTKYPEQTSARIQLTGGQYYYFELTYVESTGNDHCRIFWKNSFISNTNWNIVSAQYIYNVGCTQDPCPLRGTTCDDGNAQTTDDQEDGHCNCVGKMNTTLTCVGERGKLERYRYDNITGSTLNDLYASANFPGTPQFSAAMNHAGLPSTSGLNNFGQLVSAYISVPVSGNYRFNITGDDQTALFLSNNHDPANKQATLAIVLVWSGMTEHNKYVFQSTANVYLEAGQFYYIEINQKQGTGSSHFGLFWQTPFTPANVWKRIPAFYFYDYDCDVACIPQGTLCDDGNPFTNDDQYNEDCGCVGTPCSGPDCDSPLANYTPFPKCGLTDQLDTRPENAWLSCSVSDNPNPERERGHWIMYDLGQRYEMISSQIWNYNVEGQTQNGFEIVSVDYSEDGNTWESLGNYNWPLAPGENGYGGFNGPDFNNIRARYILIQSLDDTTTCRGLSKVAFHAVVCPEMNTVCDDGNENTVDDKYNDMCECQGINLFANPCDETIVLLQDTILNQQVIGAEISITSEEIVTVNGVAGMVAGSFVELNPGFETEYNSIFMASVAPCDVNALRQQNPVASRSENLTKNIAELPFLFVRKTADGKHIDVYFRTEGKSHTKVTVKDAGANVTYYLMDNEVLNEGLFRKRMPTKKISDLSDLLFEYVVNDKKYVARFE
jgi:hypothetical protein